MTVPRRVEAAGVVAIVLNWNGWADTIACVESLLRATRVPDRILVVDNGSTDFSFERLSAWKQRQRTGDLVELISNPENLGYAGGNNVGIRFAVEALDASFVWILNNDVIAEPDALEEMLRFVRTQPAAGIVGAKLLHYYGPSRIQALGGGYLLPLLFHDSQLKDERAGNQVRGGIRLDHVVGASLLVRVDAIRSVGLLDESYFLYREETDWCIRMRRSGWQMFCCTSAVLRHKQSQSIGFKSSAQDYYAVRNILRLVRKFSPPALPFAFLYHACRAIAPKLVRLQFARLAAVFEALYDFAAGVSGRRSVKTRPAASRAERRAITPAIEVASGLP